MTGDDSKIAMGSIGWTSISGGFLQYGSGKSAFPGCEASEFSGKPLIWHIVTPCWTVRYFRQLTFCWLLISHDIPIQNYTILINIIPWFTTIKIVVKHHLVKFTCFPQKPPGFSVKSEASESRRILNPYSMVKCSDQSMVAQTPRPFRTNLVVRKPTHQRLEPQADIHTYRQTYIHT